MHAAPAAWPLGRSIRAGVAVGGTLLVGTLLGRADLALWVAMGSVLLVMGERSTAYSARFRQIAVTAPLAAAGYLLGTLSQAPAPVTIAVMTLVALLSGLVSGYSSVVSSGSMQFMMTAAVSIGISAPVPVWQRALLCLCGAAVYSALLAIEALASPRRPERDALRALLRALRTLSARRGDGASVAEVEKERAATVAALNAYDAIALARRGTAEGPTREYARATRIARASDQLLARLLAHDADPALDRAAADRLGVIIDALTHDARPTARTDDPPTLVRVAMLEAALWNDPPTGEVRGATARAHPPLQLPGPALWGAAGRLALCTALAYAAYFLLPLPHPYWIALTVALVMKPDLGSVFARGVLRSAGTVAGAVLAIGIGLLLPVPVLLCILIGLLAAVVPWAKERSYAWQAVFLTPLIMVLLELAVPSASVVALSLERVLMTLIGSVIVIVAGYLIWPSARHTRVAEPFAAALRGLADYAGAVTAGADPATIAGLRRAVYRRLSDVRVSLQRSLGEPPPAGREAWEWLPVVDAAERVADRITDASASRTRVDISADGRALAAIATDLGSLVSPAREPDQAEVDGAGDGGHRRAVRPAADDAVDPVVRELADDVAGLVPMLTRRRAAAPEMGAGNVPPDR